MPNTLSPLSQLSLLPQDLAALRGLLLLISDPVLLLGENLELLEANPAAQQLLDPGPGQPARSLHALQTSHGGRLGDWLRLASRAQLDGRRGPPAPGLKLDNGQRASLSLVALDPQDEHPARWLLHARGEEKTKPRSSLPKTPLSAKAVSAAAGPAPDGQDSQAASAEPLPALGEASPKPAADSGPVPPQDASLAEQLAQQRAREQILREQAERTQTELASWLALSPLPMVLFDENGLLLKSNAALNALCLQIPATLQQADEALQQLLAWEHKKPSAALANASGCLLTQASLIDPGGRTRWLAGRVQALDGTAAKLSLPRRFMAILEDRSSDQERDLAYQQLDALMDTAGVGLATFAQDAGWLRPRSSRINKSSLDAKRNSLAGLQGVGRDIVEPASLPEFERLQKALKKGDRVEVRYAVRHPELGRRWLLTRVEPGQLASGQRTTSVVTLDVTAQAQAENRSEQLLHELRTIMDGAGLGLAYFRGDKLQRCNKGFEQMLGLDAAMPAGATVAQLFAALPELSDKIQAVLGELDELENKQGFEAEFLQVGSEAAQARWLSLSLRRVSSAENEFDVGPRPQRFETIAVISDISRLKTQQAELEALVQDRELMFSLSDVGIAILRNGRIARANDALAALTGYRIHELSGLNHRELFEDPLDFEHHSALVQEDLQRQGLWRGERRVRLRDGSALWMQVSKRVMRPGAPDEGLIATYVNVDDRWRAQQSLMLQTERERAVLDSVLVGIVTVGRGGIEWMNRSARRMFGGDLSEFAGLPMSMVATPDPEHPFRHTHYLDELTEGETEAFECRLKARDGREFWVVGNAVVTGSRSSGRQLTYALLDIDRRRQAEAQTQQAQASLSRIIEAAPLAISLHDAKTLRVEQINQAAAEIAGRSEHSLLGASPEDLFGREQGEVIRRDMLEALAAGAVTQREYRLGEGEQMRVWDARFLHLAGTGDGADASADGAPEQLLLVASDVTEHRAAEEARLHAAISQRELLVREVHHRIKNNLQGVAGLLQQIAARRPEVASVISEAIGQVHAIAQVYGLQVGSSGPLMVRRVMEAIIGSVQRMSGRNISTQVLGETAEQSHAWALPEAESIPIALTLNELLTNAIKHSPNSDVHCSLICGVDRVAVEIVNPGRLPAEFNLAQVPGGVSGLGLVRALLPRRSAILSLSQRGEDVVCRVELLPPSVSLGEAPQAGGP